MRSTDWFTDTATATNLILPAYFVIAALIFGSSALQLVHHVAQNCNSVGPFFTYSARSIGLPSSVSTAAPGASLPTAIPDSWALTGANANSIRAISTRFDLIAAPVPS